MRIPAIVVLLFSFIAPSSYDAANTENWRARLERELAVWFEPADGTELTLNGSPLTSRVPLTAQDRVTALLSSRCRGLETSGDPRTCGGARCSYRGS